TFGSKDQLVVAYLQSVAERDRALWQRRAEAAPDARGRILALFDIVRERVEPAAPGSCHVAAAIEFPSPATDGEHAIRVAVAEYREWISATLRSELQAMGLQDPDNISDLADRLEILHDASITRTMLGVPRTTAVTARDMAELTLGLVTDPCRCGAGPPRRVAATRRAAAPRARPPAAPWPDRPGWTGPPARDPRATPPTARRRS